MLGAEVEGERVVGPEMERGLKGTANSPLAQSSGIRGLQKDTCWTFTPYQASRGKCKIEI